VYAVRGEAAPRSSRRAANLGGGPQFCGIGPSGRISGHSPVEGTGSASLEPRLVVYAIEVAEASFGIGLSPPVAAAAEVAEQILRMLPADTG
jgi:hypothetical protein